MEVSPMHVKRLSVAAMAAVAAIGGAGEAHAATTVQKSGSLLSVTAALARTNQVTVFDVVTHVRVRDLGDLVVAGPGCVWIDPHTADCPRSGLTRGRVAVHDMNDSALTFSSLPMFLYGSDGTDTLAGGSGNDFIDGGNGPDAMFGGAGQDRVNYASKPAGVTVTLENAANDGVLNEGDNVSPTIEAVIGSPFDDRMVGSASPNVLDGRRGNDRLWGQDGADTFPSELIDGADEYNGGPGVDHVAYTQRAARVMVLLDGAPNDGDPAAAEGDNVRLDVENVTGGSRDDVLLGSTFDNRLDGALGNDHLEGRGGADTLVGGLGSDRLFGGFGNDVLDGVDGTGGNDQLDGQADVDTCTSDAGDAEANCEL
jgi:Ca2+-binding RTX toxin-like protein